MQTSDLTQHYLIVTDDGHESAFEAIDDYQAIGLSQKQYGNQHWHLFRESNGERFVVCDKSPECPQDSKPEAPPA